MPKALIRDTTSESALRTYKGCPFFQLTTPSAGASAALTIEQILALPPMTQMDLAAEPMYAAFTNHPNNSPYTARPNQIPLDTMNTPAAQLTGPAKAWAQWSAKQDWRGPDRANPAQLNRAIWYAAHGFTQPYPGESRILTPGEVPAGPTAGGDR